jgi:ribosomal protein L9
LIEIRFFAFPKKYRKKAKEADLEAQKQREKQSEKDDKKQGQVREREGSSVPLQEL